MFPAFKPTNQIVLTQGRIAIIDPDDFARASALKWFAERGKRTWYAARNARGTDGKLRLLRLHRFLLGDPDGLVDHINGNGLDNRRANLRVVTSQQNCFNMTRKRRYASSRFKGVAIHSRDGRWQASIRHCNRTIHLGFFADEASAARAYDLKAAELFGEYACLNFPGGTLVSGF